MSKSKRRREARRRAARAREGPAAGRPAEEPELSGAAPAPSSPTVQAQRPRKHRKGTDPAWPRRLRALRWVAAAGVAVAIAAFLAFAVMSGGSSGTGDLPPSPTPDARVAGLDPEVSFDIEAAGGPNDARFIPTTVNAKAGQVIELVVTNSGSVTHNLRVSGPNKEYDVDTTGKKGDDFEMPPRAIQPDNTYNLVVKIDDPGSYPFRCDFHPQTQRGTLALSE